ncbi:MAG: DUF3786 domain-containing protein [Deltaproteobacteria bacterium]|jgi:hypothetical protein|nr:DUF3786 domain-containing protein [Deltaproteobacteria bacterium]
MTTPEMPKDRPPDGTGRFLDFASHPLWDDLLAVAPETASEKSGADFRREAEGLVYSLTFLGGTYILKSAGRAAFPPPGRPEPAYETKTLLLAYLAKAASGPSPGLSGREIGPHSLPSGDLFFKGPHELPKAPLAAAFGDDPEALARASAAIGAERRGPLSWKARVLPNVEVYWYIEPADDEFPAEARYNFDSNIRYYLTFDMIFYLTLLLAERLIALKGA